MAAIKETKNYGRFELHRMNRDIGRTSALERSMEDHGWIDAYPMHVVKNGSHKLKIKAGHHRFEVAQKLGLPVKYVVCEDDASIQKLENASRGWSIRDYLDSFVRMKKKDYIHLEAYCSRTGIGITGAISLMAGDTQAGHGHTGLVSEFKEGRFKITDDHLANVVGDIVMAARAAGFKYATSRSFVMSVGRLASLDEFEPARLMDKATRFPERMTKRASTRDYDSMLTDLYNWYSSDKVKLGALVELAEAR